MKLYLVDTNCILRYLLNDIPAQAEIIQDYILRAKKGTVGLYIPLLVIIEIDFTLVKYYGFSKNEVVTKLSEIIRIPFIEVEKRSVIQNALLLYSQVNFEFVDIVLFFEAKQSGRELLTFDKKLKKLKSS